MLTTHIRPDGDAIGSLIGLCRILDNLDKQVTMACADVIPAVYRFLPDVRRIRNTIVNPGVFDTGIFLDCGDASRAGDLAQTVFGCPVVINIDHHITNSDFGHYRLVDPAACATAEIIYRLREFLEVPLDRWTATALYIGILTDTGSFRFSNTNRAAFSICETLVACGVEPYEVAQHLYGTYSLGRLRLLNMAIDSIEISENGRLSMMTLTRDMMNETGAQPEDLDGMIHYAKRIEHVKVAVLIRELKNGSTDPNSPHGFHVSLRSDGAVDVGEIASMFGGGGHNEAAGFNIQTTLDELKMGLLNLAEKI